MSSKKILIITYYWPPSGGSGVQRWLKFVKYLPQFGWQPYVFTPENPSFSIRDESLLKDIPIEAEVIRFPIWEPYEAFFKLSSVLGKKKSSKPTDLVSMKDQSLFQKISTFVRGNFLIPDPRVFWVRPSVKFLNDFLRDNEINTIVTTGPPHSVHLIGLKLKDKNPSLTWIADFRDPWSEWGLLDSLKVGSIARTMHRKLEAKVLQRADKVITITPFYVRRFETLSQRKVTLLTNGYDEDDFKSMIIQRNNKFTIRHAGIINEKCDPKPFMHAVLHLLKNHMDLKSKFHIDFVGEVHQQFKEFVLSNEDLSAITSFTASVPHQELISLYGTSSMLLLILTGYKDAEGYMPGKLFEYLATGLPILGIGPAQGDAAKLLNTTDSGDMIDEVDKEKIQKKLMEHFEAWDNGTSVVRPGKGTLYSRREITKQLTDLI
jgi:glycosyltransferase involved in cell wall biosynthesis